MSDESPVLGIDLGTTNSCAAVMAEEPVVIPLEGSGYTIRSVVGFSGNDVLVGEAAQRQAAANPLNTVFGAKRLIGRSFDDPETQVAMEGFPYKCVRGGHGDVRVQVGEGEFAIEEISAKILASIKDAAQNHLGTEVNRAVITVPAYFNDRQRTATKTAGKMAGLEVLSVINEPTSAALAYGLGKGREHNVVVYDLGGGTFDVSVLRVGGSVAEVQASAGDAFLGGHDFDAILHQWILKQIQAKHGCDFSQDASAMERLRAAAEAAKINLSDSESTRIAIPFIGNDHNSMPVHVDLTLTRIQFEEMTQELVERTVQTMLATLADASMTPEDIDGLLFVGGMTCMPAIRQRVEGILKCETMSGVHPDLVVAVGAAIHCAALIHGDVSTTLQDVTPHNLGIQIAASLADTILPKNTKLPAEATRKFTTVRDNQTSVRIVVCQGASRKVADNDVLGSFRLEGIEPAPAGETDIEVTFAISADGIVEVSALDSKSGKSEILRIDEKIETTQEVEGAAAEPTAQATAAASLPADGEPLFDVADLGVLSID